MGQSSQPLLGKTCKISLQNLRRIEVLLDLRSWYSLDSLEFTVRCFNSVTVNYMTQVFDGRLKECTVVFVCSKAMLFQSL